MDLSRLPASIQRLVFTVSIDGSGTMGEIASHTAAVRQDGQDALALQLNGSDFHSEKAIISIELYKKDVWRFGAVAQRLQRGPGRSAALLWRRGGHGRRNPPSPSAPPQADAPAKVELRKPEDQPAQEYAAVWGRF